jgi:hypothetical protein
MATTIEPRPVSPFDAAAEAFAHTRRQLFPIRIERWLALGLLAFLDQCGRSFRGGGGGGHSGWRHEGPIGDGGLSGQADRLFAAIQRAAEWLTAHAAAVAIGSLVGLLVVAALMAVVLWFNARGVFMYVDDVATGRSDVSRPWRQHASAASSYFTWSLGISLAGIFVLLFAAGLVVAGTLAFASGRLHGSGAWLAAAGMAPVLGLLLLGLLLLALAALALRDFVAPLQLATGLPCGAAARVLEGLVLAHPGAFVLYLVLKLVVVVVSGVVIVIGGCLTCCLGFLPIVMQIVFQPLFYFERALSVFLLRQMGHDVASRLGA